MNRMKFGVMKVVPLQVVISNKSGVREYLEKMVARMIEEMMAKQSEVNATEGEYRVNVELMVERSSLNL